MAARYLLASLRSLLLALLATEFLLQEESTWLVEGSRSVAAALLTANCSDQCEKYTPCLVRSEADAESSRFHCVGQEFAKDGTFKFLVPVGTDGVTAIDALDLDPEITHFTLAGGRSSVDALKDVVASVELDPNLIGSATQVTDVTLVSLDLATAIAHLPSMLPSSVTQLRLNNDLLTTFPTISLLPLRSLTNLSFDFNSIETVDASAYTSSITWLSLQGNGMHSFDGYFPNLQTLLLTNNRFTAIPESVYQLKSLTTLKMAGNLPLSREFTADHVAFLRNLAWDLTDDSFARLNACQASLQTLHGVTVCVTSAVTRPTFTNGGQIDRVRARSQVERQLYSYSGGSYCPGYYSGGVLAGSVIGTAVFMLLVGVFVWRWKSRSMKLKGNTEKSQDSDDAYVSAWVDPQLLALQLKVDDLQDVRKIGGGAFADVWLVKYRNTQLLASKRLRKEHESSQYTESFIEEIKLVARFDHPSITKLVGVAWTVESDLQALSEYMVGGDLREYLIYPCTPRVWTALKLQIAIDVVEALVYVHSFAPAVIHRDLKSRNVLLSREMRAKLTDFGVSRFMSEENTMTQGVGTSRWAAPEVLAGKEDYNQAADIFSFGVLLSELDTHAIPYDDARGSSGNVLANVAILQMIARGALRPSFSADCPPDMRALAERCLARDPSQRPTAPEVAYALRTTTI